MVFQYDGLFVGAGWVEQSAEYGRVLLGDGQERDGDDDPAAAVECRVAQGECRRGQRLARSGGRRQAVDSGGSFGGGDGRLVHLFPPPVYRGGRALCDQLGATSGEPVPQLRKVRGRRDPGSLESPAVRRGVEAVRVDQAGVEEADQELTVELVLEADRERYRGRVEQFRQQRPQGVLGAGTTQQPVLGLLLQQRLAHSAGVGQSAVMAVQGVLQHRQRATGRQPDAERLVVDPDRPAGCLDAGELLLPLA